MGGRNSTEKKKTETLSYNLELLVVYNQNPQGFVPERLTSYLVQHGIKGTWTWITPRGTNRRNYFMLMGHEEEETMEAMKAHAEAILAGLHIQRRGPGEVSSEENVYRWDGMMKAEGYSAPYPSASGGPMQEVFPQMMVETVVKRFSNAEEGGWHQDVEGAPTQTVDHPVETGRSAPTEKDSGLFMNKGLKLKKWKKRGG